MKPSKYNDILFQGAKGSTFANADFLRKNETNAEKILWKYLRAKRLKGFKFRRQHPIIKFVVDFYCAEKKLAVELDGSVHDNLESRNYDTLKAKELDDYGIKILRFRNSEVERNLDSVLKVILKELEKL